MSAADVAGVPFIVNNPALLPAIPLQILPPAPGVPFVTMGRSIHEITRWDRLCEPLRRRTVVAALALTVNRRLNALRASRGLPRLG